MYPISIALLLDSFHKTVMELGSITDEVEEAKPWKFKQVREWVFILRPWSVLEKAEKELKN